jgi:hypothetical protein
MVIEQTINKQLQFTYFLTIEDKIIDKNRNDTMGQSNNNINPLNCVLKILKHSFSNIEFNYMSADETEKNYKNP